MALPYLTLDEAYRLFDGLCERRDRALNRGQVAAVLRIDKELEELMERIRELEIEHPDETMTAKAQQMIEQLERDRALDELTADASAHFIGRETASVAEIQRTFGVGYTRAARIMDQLEDLGIVEPFGGIDARKVLVGRELVESAGVSLVVPPLQRVASEDHPLDQDVAGFPAIGWLLLIAFGLFAWLLLVLQQ